MATLEDVIRGGNYVLASRALVLEGDLTTVVDEIPGYLLDGSIGFERNREVPRSGSIAVANDDGRYTPDDEAALTWPGRIWRVERGALVDGIPQYEPLITGIVDDVSEDEQGAKVTLTIWSRLSLADQFFSSPISFTIGTRVGVAVRTILELAGLGVDDDLYALDDYGATLQALRAYDVQENMLEQAHALASANGLELYEDALGIPTMGIYVDPATRTPDFVFEEGETALITDQKRSLKARRPIYNRVNVTGIGPDMYPIEAEARDLNPASPTYNPIDGTGPLGDRPRPRFYSADIRTQAAANSAALRLLYEAALADETRDIAAMPVPWISERSVVAFPDDPTVHLLDRVAMPVRDGAMALSARRVRSLIAP